MSHGVVADLVPIRDGLLPAREPLLNIVRFKEKRGFDSELSE